MQSLEEISARIMKKAITDELKLESLEELDRYLRDPEKLTIFDVDELSPRNIVKICCSMSQGQLTSRIGSDSPELIQLASIFSINSISLDRCTFGGGDEWNDNEIGQSLCIFGSLFNHSCNSNIGHVTLDNKIVFFVNRPIKAGEQLFINYDAIKFSRMTLNKRQQKLKKYGFVCDCDACKNDIPLVQNLHKLDKFRLIPLSKHSTVHQSIEIFKENCKLIDDLQHEHPCYDTSVLIDRNSVLLDQIANVTL